MNDVGRRCHVGAGSDGAGLPGGRSERDDLGFPIRRPGEHRRRSERCVDLRATGVAGKDVNGDRLLSLTARRRWTHGDSNPGPLGCQPSALPAELWALGCPSLPGGCGVLLLPLEPRRVTPQPLQVVVGALFLAEHMDDDVDVIQEPPASLVLALATDRLLPQRTDRVARSLRSRSSAGGSRRRADHEVVGDHDELVDVQDGDVGGPACRRPPARPLAATSRLTEARRASRDPSPFLRLPSSREVLPYDDLHVADTRCYLGHRDVA